MALPVTAAVDICANALRLLGDDPITSLTEDSERARLCNALYDPTRDATLRAHVWNFAMRRASLNKLVDKPLFEWGAQFQLPTDPYCLRVVKIDDPMARWKVEGRVLLCDNSSVKILYIARIEDVSQYDAMFVDALTHRLAAKLAYPVTGSVEKARQFQELYLMIVAEARALDGMEGSPEALDVTDLLEVR